MRSVLKSLGQSGRSMAFAMACMTVAMAPASAQTIEELKAKGKVVVGIQAESPPFGFIDTSGNSAGFDADIAEIIGKEIGVPVEFQRVLTANRIPLLLTGKIDMIAAILGMYPERAKQVQFSKPYSSFDIIVIGPNGSALADMAGMDGKRVGVPRGSAPDVSITKSAPGSVEIQRYDDEAANIQALLSGQVDFIGGTSVNLLNINKVAPGQFEEKFLISRQFNGIGLRPGQKELLTVVNKVIDDLRANGKLAETYQRWLNQDPPEFPEAVEGVPFTID